MKNYILYGLFEEGAVGALKYIGITRNKLEKRFQDHLYECNTKRDTKKLRWLRKLIREERKIGFIALAEGLSKEEAVALEIDYIKMHRNIGLELKNTTDGGEGIRKSFGYKHSPEALLKISISQKGRIFSEETKKKMSEAAKKKKPVSEETRKKISIGNKGKKVTDETKKKMGEAGRKRMNNLSEQEKKKYTSNLYKDGKSPWLGREFTEEHKLKLRKPKTDEHKKRLAEAARLRWQIRKQKENE